MMSVSRRSRQNALPLRMLLVWTILLISIRLAESTNSDHDDTTRKVDESTAAASNAYNYSIEIQDIPPNRGGITKVIADDDAFLKPDPDLREYRWIQLANNLQVLLVGTTKTTSSDNAGEEVTHVEAASVHVKAGHFDDTIAGLAHFNEHMLFLGTEKYPEENEYENFLQKYGGSSNAYTAMEDTNYYYSLKTTTGGSKNSTTNDRDDDSTCASYETSEALEGSLDRLAQFFIAPKFETGMVDREVKAIDSEWRNGRTEDSRRTFQHLKSSANPKHPFSNFGCGNIDTLTKGNTTSPRPALLDFWNRHYQTFNLRLAVVGYASLDSLQASVERTFGQLPFSEGNHRTVPVKPMKGQSFPYEHSHYERGLKAFGPTQLGKYRQLIPLMESRRLALYFATPPLDDPLMKKTKPHGLISHLLEHEGPGTLHALLNDLGYIQGLYSDMDIATSDFSLFGLTMSLTPKGSAHKDYVLDLTFQWIALILGTALDPDNLSLMRQYQNELRTLSHNNFKFRENGDPEDFCSSITERMFDTGYPPHLLLRGNADNVQYDPDVMKAFLDRLKPSNCMIVETNSDLVEDEMIQDQLFKDGWQIEPLYGVQHRVRDLSEDQMRAWEKPHSVDARLHRPGLNQFIPTNFSLHCDNEDPGMTNGSRTNASEADRTAPPKLLMERPGLRLWHKMDKYWRVPKASIRFSILSPSLYRSARTMAYNRIYQRILNDDLASTTYDATLAGSAYSVTCEPTGIQLSVAGYNEKLLNLLKQLTERMLSLVEELKQGPVAYPALNEKFEKAKEDLLRETKNSKLDAPYQRANYNADVVMAEKIWFIDEYILEMEGAYAEVDPMSMVECAKVAEEALTGRHKVEAMCMGNINENQAHQACQIVENLFFANKQSRPLMESEIPTFRSMQLPTRQEAQSFFGQDLVEAGNRSVPLVYQELAFSPSEDNHAVEYIMQTGSELELGYKGLALLQLLSHISYNSAFNQLRTIEQLGYIVSTQVREIDGGGWCFSVVVQSSVAIPEVLEERVEAWIKQFHSELEEKDQYDIAMEAAAVVSQLKERHTKLSQEVSSFWRGIVNTETYSNKLREPAFDRIDRIADELVVADEALSKSSSKTINGNDRMAPAMLKRELLNFMDRFIAAGASSRRAMSSRVYNQEAKELFEANRNKPGVLSTFSDAYHLKQFLKTWPIAPYWRKR